jgi:hypothetical protein
MVSDEGLFGGVLLPNDHTCASLGPFYHALRLAMMARSHLHVIHIDTPTSAEVFDAFPRVRETLSRWLGLPSITEDDLLTLGLGVRKIQARHEHRLLLKHASDLLIMPAYRDKSNPFNKNRKQLFDRTQGLNLIIPEGVKGFIDAHGQIHLTSVLIPIFHASQLIPVSGSVQKLARILGVLRLNATLLWLGPQPHHQKDAPVNDDFWSWHVIAPAGDQVVAIVEAATRSQADLIAWVPPQLGTFKASFSRDLRQSLLEKAPCPLLSVLSVPKIS